MARPNPHERRLGGIFALGWRGWFLALAGFSILTVLPHSARAGGSRRYSGLAGVSQCVAVDKNYAYLGVEGCTWDGYSYWCKWGLAVFDISNPEFPRWVGWQGDHPYFRPPSSIAVNGKFVYVGDYDFGVYDVSNPSSPLFMGSLPLSGIEGIAVEGTYAYLADGSGFLRVVDIRTPASPELIGSVETSGAAHAVAVSGSYAYVAADSSGVDVVDISVPDSPVLVGGIATPDRALDVAARGLYVYVACDSSLEILDVSDPQSPVIAGSVEATPPNRAGRIALRRARAYLTGPLLGDNYYGLPLLVVDISNPTRPAALTSVPEYAYGVAADEQRVCVVGVIPNDYMCDEGPACWFTDHFLEVSATGYEPLAHGAQNGE